MRKKHSRPRGFTLIEVMVAVAILALFASIAYPHYWSSSMRAQRLEAVLNLEAINAMQLSFYGDHDRFASSFHDIDFATVGATIDATTMVGQRYTYTLSQPWGERSWMCTASADLDGDEWPDVIMAYERL